MSVTLAIRFLAGQFHATPWNHQVNEGIVEWPPAPWRLLRTLVAVAHRMPEPPQRALLGGLVAKLATALPAYQLPPTQSAHTRHYMPLVSEGEWTTTQVLDTFRVMAKGAAVHVCWPQLVLDATERLAGAAVRAGQLLGPRRVLGRDGAAGGSGWRVPCRAPRARAREQRRRHD